MINAHGYCLVQSSTRLTQSRYRIHPGAPLAELLLMSSLPASGAPTVALALGVRPALNLVDGLRRCGVDRDVSVPQICVVGDQSSGKSSVLEAICLVPLPRAAGLTTRCAIELHLSDGRTAAPVEEPASPPSEFDDDSPATDMPQWSATIATSVNQTPVPVSSPNELSDAITARTEALTADRRSSGFSSERIIVRICAPDLPNLTLIDLPGYEFFCAELWQQPSMGKSGSRFIWIGS